MLAPALVRGVREGRHGCARWLAHFGQELLQAQRALIDLPEEHRTVSGLLREALRIEPGDTRARRRLVEDTARYLAYTLHELPAGVLYGHDGATLAQCDELLGSLDDFCRHVDALAERPRYAELISRCRYHYGAYRQYLSSRRPGNRMQSS